jgi:Tfp pilus assembly protein PilN
VEVEKIASAILVYGPLGVIAFLAIMVAVRKDMELTKERQAFLTKQEELMSKHQVELQSLEERFISKSETWMTKYHELATSQNATITALKGLVDQLRGA